MLKSVARLQATELGFRPDSVLSVRLALPSPQVQPAARRTVLRTAPRAPRRSARARRCRIWQLPAAGRRMQWHDGHVSRSSARAARQQSICWRAVGFAAVLRDARNPPRARPSLHGPRSRRTAEGRCRQRNSGQSVLEGRKSDRQADRRGAGTVSRTVPKSWAFVADVRYSGCRSGSRPRRVPATSSVTSRLGIPVRAQRRGPGHPGPSPSHARSSPWIRICR